MNGPNNIIYFGLLFLKGNQTVVKLWQCKYVIDAWRVFGWVWNTKCLQTEIKPGTCLISCSYKGRKSSEIFRKLAILNCNLTLSNRFDILTARAIIFHIHQLISMWNSCNVQSAFYTVHCRGPSSDKSAALDESCLPSLQPASVAEASSRSLYRAAWQRRVD